MYKLGRGPFSSINIALIDTAPPTGHPKQCGPESLPCNLQKHLVVYQLSGPDLFLLPKESFECLKNTFFLSISILSINIRPSSEIHTDDDLCI